MSELTDEQLRGLANREWNKLDSADLAAELLALRARVVQLEAALQQIIYNDDAICEEIALAALRGTP